METKELGEVLVEIKGSVESLVSKQREQQAQLDAVDQLVQNRPNFAGGFGGEDILGKALEESGELKRMREIGKGKAVISVGDLNQVPMQRKLLTSVGMTGTPGVMQPQQVGGIVTLAQRRLFLRDLLYRGNRTTTNQVYFVKENTFVNNASPQVSEGSLKAETTNTYTTVSQAVATIAHWLAVSRQVFDDAPALADAIKTKLLYGLRFKEESYILSADGTNGNINGLIGQASAFNTGLLGSSFTRLDILRRALEQVELADEVPAGFFVLNPADVANIDLQKNTLGDYIVGSPNGTAAAKTLWGKPVVSTNAISAGTFLAGSSESAELIDRMDATVEASFEDRDNFVRNAVTLLCEERTVLCTYRPGAFVYGSLESSPA